MPTPETETRLKLLKNGYVPLLNRGKRPIHKKWQVQRVNADKVLKWDRSVHKSTGIRVEYGLAVIDVDIEFPDWPELVEQLAAEAQVILPGVFERGLVRFSTGVKEAWFVRVDGVRFGRLASRLWMRTEDVNADPDVKAPRARIEIFGGGSTRQFGSFGPHSYNEDGQAITFYHWDGPSPAEVPLADLPAYCVDAFGRLCDAFDTIAASAGLIEKARPRRFGDTETLYFLEPGMVVELQDGTSATVAELERIAPQLRGGADYRRCSGTFHSLERTRRDSHTIAMGRHGIGIHDFMEGVTYCRRDREPPARHDIGEALRRFSAERLGAAIDQQGEADDPAGPGESEARYGDEQEAETECVKEEEEEEVPDAQAESPSPPLERRARPLSSVPVDEESNVSHVRGVVWLVEEMAFCRSAFHGRGGVMPIYPGGDDALVVVASMKTEMRPYDRIEINSRGTIKRISPVDTWLALPEKVSVAGRRLRPDMPRPLFEEAGALYVNRYAPPAHPVQGGQTRTFDIFLERLVPNRIERDWFLQWLAHKICVPWVPMVATIMVAEDFGSGRGTLGEVLALILGAQFFKECEFSMLTGSSAAARFNSMFAESLFVIVNEAAEEEGHKFSVRRTAYEVLKGVVDPNGSALRRYEAKNQDAWMQRAFMSLLIATNHPDAVKLPKGDRRFAVISNGPKMTREERAAIRAWMAVPENIGALYRKLLALPVAASFDPYMPPTFDGKREMIDLARSSLDIAWGMAREEIRGRLFTGTQAITLMGRTGMLYGIEWQKQARNLLPRWSKRLRDSAKTEVRVRFNRQREIVYAVDEAARTDFANADNVAIVAELTATEKGLVATPADPANDAGPGARMATQGIAQALVNFHQANLRGKKER